MRKAIYFRILQYNDENVDLLRHSFDLKILDTPEDLGPSTLQGVEVLFAPLGYSFDAPLIEKCPSLKVIATNTTGVPHIDVEYARKKDIVIVSLKDDREFLATITPTAELTIGLIISITRNVVRSARSVLNGEWNRWDHGGQFMLSRASLGIVGLGRLGRMVARYGAAMGARVRYYDPYVSVSSIHKELQRYETLDELLQESQIVSIHLPLNSETRNLFSTERFEKIRPGAYLVNTARGEIVDSAALIGALETGKLAGAAVDVLDGEFDPGFRANVLDHPLVRYAKQHENLIITPHIGGSTLDAWHMTQRYTINRAISALNH